MREFPALYQIGIGGGVAHLCIKSLPIIYMYGVLVRARKLYSVHTCSSWYLYEPSVYCDMSLLCIKISNAVVFGAVAVSAVAESAWL